MNHVVNCTLSVLIDLCMTGKNNNSNLPKLKSNSMVALVFLFKMQAFAVSSQLDTFILLNLPVSEPNNWEKVKYYCLLTGFHHFRKVKQRN